MEVIEMLAIKEGAPGGGKTHHLIGIIISRLKQGKNVVSNIKFNYQSFLEDNKNLYRPGLYFYVVDADLTIEYLMLHAHLYHDFNRLDEAQTLLIVDESRERFDARNWQTDKTRPAWRVFFEQHRKFKYSIILVAQTAADIDPKIVDKAEYIETHRQINNFSSNLWFLKFFKMKLFICIIRYNNKSRRVFKKEYFRLRKKYSRYYNTSDIMGTVERDYIELVDKYNNDKDLQHSKKLELYAAMIGGKSDEIESINYETK